MNIQTFFKAFLRELFKRKMAFRELIRCDLAKHTNESVIQVCGIFCLIRDAVHELKVWKPETYADMEKLLQEFKKSEHDFLVSMGKVEG